MHDKVDYLHFNNLNRTKIKFKEIFYILIYLGLVKLSNTNSIKGWPPYIVWPFL